MNSVLGWDQNFGLSLRGFGIVGLFCLGIFFYVLSAVLLLLRYKREIGTCAILGYYCNLISTIVFFVSYNDMLEYISLPYYIAYIVLNIVAVFILLQNNEVT